MHDKRPASWLAQNLPWPSAVLRLLLWIILGMLEIRLAVVSRKTCCFQQHFAMCRALRRTLSGPMSTPLMPTTQNTRLFTCWVVLTAQLDQPFRSDMDKLKPGLLIKHLLILTKASADKVKSALKVFCVLCRPRQRISGLMLVPAWQLTGQPLHACRSLSCLTDQPPTVDVFSVAPRSGHRLHLALRHLLLTQD